jgi:hypothetical protein
MFFAHFFLWEKSELYLKIQSFLYILELKMLTGLEAQNVSTCGGGRGFNSHPVQKLALFII